MNAETGRKFHFIRVIASGGFGSVYLAKELHADGFARVVAVKLLHSKWSENEEIASRMRDEARLLGQIRHRHIVDVRDLTRIDGRVAVVMEYLEAVDLKDIVHGCLQSETTVPVRVGLEIAADVASALDAAYNRPPYAGEKPLRVIHRDIKPSNVMVDDQGNAKVLDFGVARADFQGRESETQELSFGSVEYMPPERLFFEPESPASDIYSLGATLYELLARAKFGKAKLRPALHDQHVDERLDELFAAHPPGDEEVREEVDLLLTEMLSFDETDRPTAADCAIRMRDMASQLSKEPGLTSWARAVVPPLLKLAHAESESQPVDDTLVNRILEEDSKGFVRGATPPTLAPEPVVQSEADRAFDALKERTLAARTPAPTSRSEAPASTGLGVPPPPPRRSLLTNSAPIKRQIEPQRRVSPPPPPPRKAAMTPATDVARVDPATLPNRRHQRAEPPAQAPAAKEGPPPRTAVMAPPPRREVEESPAVAMVELDDDLPPTRSSSGLVKGVAAALFTIALVSALVVVVGVGVVFGPGLLGEGSGEVAAPVATTPVEEAAAVEVAEEPAPIEGPAASFRSALAGTRKLTVRCEDGAGEGEMSATVAGETFGACTITAMDASRLRLTAVVEDARPGEYLCFVEGQTECEAL